MENSNWEKLIQSLIKEAILHSPRVTNAMLAVPRRQFLPPNMQAHSAVDTPLPIGFGQTISAPHSSDLVELGETW